MNEIIPAVEAWLAEHEGTLPGVERRPDGTFSFPPGTGTVRSARAVYEAAAALFEAGVIGVPVLHWEEMGQDERDGWARIQAAGAPT